MTLNTRADRNTEYTTCASCGAIVPGGTEVCHKLCEEVLALGYSYPAYGAVHLCTVDAYTLQHSEQHGPRSNAFHFKSTLPSHEGKKPHEAVPG